MTAKRFFVAFALVAVVLAGVVSYFASSDPDGLSRAAADHGLTATEREHAAADNSPFAGYGTEGIDNGAVSGGVAGVVGVGVVLLLAGGLALVVRRTSNPD